jgi:hypothetical protein
VREQGSLLGVVATAGASKAGRGLPSPRGRSGSGGGRGPMGARSPR